jgi:hypothetical protein
MHVPAATLPNGETFPLVHGDGDYALQFTAEMQGELVVDGTSVTLAALIERPRHRCVGGIYSIPLAPGAQARVRHGALTFFIHSVAPGVVTARKSEIDKPFWVTNGGAFAVLGSLLMLTHLIPARRARSASRRSEEHDRFVGYLAQPNQKRRRRSIEDTEKEEVGGVAGERHRGAEGKAGNPELRSPRVATPSRARPTAIPTMARDFDPEMRARNAGILG